MANLFLKNTATKWQSNLIDLNSALVLLGSQTLDHAKNWFIFIDGEKEEWVNILESKVVLSLFKGVTQVQPEIEEAKTESVELPKEFFNPEKHEPISQETFDKMSVDENETESLKADQNSKVVTVDELRKSEKRMHPRFDIRLRVIIKSGKNTFLTYTSDVSLGGLSLVNDVPQYIFNAEAEIYITAPDQKNNIMLICSPVASKLGKTRLMFTKIDESKQKVLATWLHHVIKPNLKSTSQGS